MVHPIYNAIIHLLFPDALYTTSTIPIFGQKRSIPPFNESVEMEQSRLIAQRMRLKLKRLADKHDFPAEGDGLLSVGDFEIVPAWYGARWQEALGLTFKGWYLLNPFTVYSPAAVAAVLRPGDSADLDFFRRFAPEEVDGKSGEAQLYFGWRWLLKVFVPEKVLSDLELPNGAAFISISCLSQLLRAQGQASMAGKLDLFPEWADHAMPTSSVPQLCSILLQLKPDT